MRTDIGGVWGRRDAGQRTPSSEHRVDCYDKPWQAVCAHRSAYRERASRPNELLGEHPRLRTRVPAGWAGRVGVRPARARATQAGLGIRVTVCLWGAGTVARAPRIRFVGPTAMGFNHAEAEAAGAADPKPLPMQMLDYATGHLMAFAASAALLRQMNEGGSWHVRVSLAQTGQWIRCLGRVPDGFGVAAARSRAVPGGNQIGVWRSGRVRHSAQFSLTPARWTRPSVPPGTDPPTWP